MFLETNPIPIKAARAMVGKARNELRLPMTPLSASCRQELTDRLRAFGLEPKS
jgi:4-hydroxy-tetrahydrodipicolinate synthase